MDMKIKFDLGSDIEVVQTITILSGLYTPADVIEMLDVGSLTVESVKGGGVFDLICGCRKRIGIVRKCEMIHKLPYSNFELIE